jgi:DNA-binding NtrC family response regulator
MYRLVAYAPNGVRRYNLDRGEMILGSDQGCDIVLPFAGVGHSHARVKIAGDLVTIEDLGSRRGILVNGDKVKSASLQPLDEIRLGSIALLLEDLQPEVQRMPEVRREPEAREPTISAEKMLQHLARVSRWVLADSSSSTALESLVLEILEDFAGGVLILFQGEPDKLGIKFVIATDALWLGRGDEILQQVLAAIRENGGAAAEEIAATCGRLDGKPAWLTYRSLQALERQYLFVGAFPAYRPSEAWSPLAGLRTLADQLILGLVHHVGQYEPIIFSRREQQRDLTLEPGLVVGESKAIKRTLEELRAAVDLEEPVLLRGEPGVAKELLARSLHLSGSRSAQPFLIASCLGASVGQIEADLFGAEVPGRHEPVEREGKLLLASGGTLYIEHVDLLPLRLQDRLVRFLRSGEVEPVDSLRSRKVDVRLIASSQAPLEHGAARDLFRIDLAYRLSQFVVEVPPLRERREDLPLLIQAAINRCCHQTGKRVQGITVKAMEALTTHDYPGNLAELESIVRRLVYLCPKGRPIDDSHLPDEIRLSKVKGPRPQAESELHLDRLIEACERAAIREALQRADGNKSEAARLLGLSRNGLAMKMTRLSLGG